MAGTETGGQWRDYPGPARSFSFAALPRLHYVLLCALSFFKLNNDASSPICSNDMGLDMIINSTHRPIN